MTPEENLALIHRVLSFMPYDDHTLDLWPQDDGTIMVAVICHDAFHLGGADHEEVTPANVEVFAEVCREVHAVWPPGPIYDREIGYHIGVVFAARQRDRQPHPQRVRIMDARVRPLIAGLPPPGGAP